MIRSIFRRYRLQILLAYLLFAVEFIIFALLPYMLGVAIDGMLLKHSTPFNWYVITCCVVITLGLARRRVDTRVFATMWSRHTAGAIEGLMARGIESSSIISRSHYAQVYTNFFEYSLPSMMSGILNIIVSLVMIWIVSLKGGIACSSGLMITLASCYYFACRMQDVDYKFQEAKEEIDASTLNSDIDAVHQGYRRQCTLMIQRSDLDASNWFILDAISIGCQIVLALYIIESGESVGTIMSTLNYANRLFDRVDVLSFFFENCKQIQIAYKLLYSNDCPCSSVDREH